MKTTSLSLNDVKVIEPTVFEDKRGFFYESFNQQKFNEAIGKEVIFVQDNHSKSSRGVLRGLHYQKAPYEQGKLVRVISGEIFDVAVDIRKNSSNYGKWISITLSESNRKQLWIPRGFAHGFLVLSEFAEVVYKTDNFYSKENEITLPWNSHIFNIEWPIENSSCLIMSDKDNV